MNLNTFNQYTMIFEASKSLQMNLPDDIIQLHQVFKKNGYKLFVVGGAVRDVLMKKTPKDFDLATDATPEEVFRITSAYKHVRDGSEKHGVAKVVIPSEPGGAEIATFRKDIGKGRRPDEVEFTTIDQDVKRRDLTMNALFYDIDSGEIVDLVGGVPDIEKNIIRSVGDAKERFDEDALRKLRAIRFAGRSGAELSPEIDAALKADNSLPEVSEERIRDEFSKMIKTSISSNDVLNLLTKYDFFPLIFPELKVNETFLESNNWIVQLATLLKDNDEKAVRTILNKMRYEAKEIENVVYLQNLKNLKPENVVEQFKAKNKTSLTSDDLIEYATANLDVNTIKAFTNYKPTTTAQEVEALGVKKGPLFGQKIKELEAEKFKSLLKT